MIQNMHEETEAIRAHYNASPRKEWDRLKIRHPYEKYITVSMMDRYIRPDDAILDIDGNRLRAGKHSGPLQEYSEPDSEKNQNGLV